MSAGTEGPSSASESDPAPTPGSSSPVTPDSSSPVTPALPRRRSAWAARPRGAALMAGLELRQKVRSVRWYVALAVWFVAVTGTSTLILVAFRVSTGAAEDAGDIRPVTGIVFSLITLFLVFAMLAVLPALSAGSINGERGTGTLAILQVSLLTPMEIALGKLAAGWITGLAFIVAALPALLTTALIGSISPLYVLRVLVMIAVLALCITAVGLGLSALASRQLGSVVLAYLLVIGATFVLPIIWGATSALLTQERQVTAWEQSYDDASDEPTECTSSVQERQVARTDIPLPLLWPNPMVLVADMSPSASDPDPDRAAADPLQVISLGVRWAGDPLHPAYFDSCDPSAPGHPGDLGSPSDRPVWPMGLGIWVLGGAGALAFTVVRLATPMRRIARGERIA